MQTVNEAAANRLIEIIDHETIETLADRIQICTIAENRPIVTEVATIDFDHRMLLEPDDLHHPLRTEKSHQPETINIHRRIRK